MCRTCCFHSRSTFTFEAKPTWSRTDPCKNKEGNPIKQTLKNGMKALCVCVYFHPNYSSFFMWLCRTPSNTTKLNLRFVKTMSKRDPSRKILRHRLHMWRMLKQVCVPVEYRRVEFLVWTVCAEKPVPSQTKKTTRKPLSEKQAKATTSVSSCNRCHASYLMMAMVMGQVGDGFFVIFSRRRRNLLYSSVPRRGKHLFELRSRRIKRINRDRDISRALSIRLSWNDLFRNDLLMTNGRLCLKIHSKTRQKLLVRLVFVLCCFSECCGGGDFFPKRVGDDDNFTHRRTQNVTQVHPRHPDHAKQRRKQVKKNLNHRHRCGFEILVEHDLGVCETKP